MTTTTVTIDRFEDDPTAIDITLKDEQGRAMGLSLSNLEPGQADDLSVLRLVTEIIENAGGSVESVLDEATESTR